MRLSILVLLLLSLVVRWADGACGCAAHNGWLTLAIGHSHSEESHEHSSSEKRCHEACEGESERALYLTVSRILPPATADLVLSPSCIEPQPLAAVSHAVVPSDSLSRAPSRALLNVYRI